MADNTVTLVGNVTRDPELRYTSGGRGVASFGLAVNRRYQSNGEWQEQTSFFDVVAWGTLGENAAASLHKGTRAVVYGRLEQRSWDTEDGSKRTKIEVIADEIGPSLRWAQAQVEKTARTTGEGGQQGSAPAPTAPRAGRPRLHRRRAVLSGDPPRQVIRREHGEQEEPCTRVEGRRAAPVQEEDERPRPRARRVRRLQGRRPALALHERSGEDPQPAGLRQRRAAAARRRRRDQDRPGDGVAAVRPAGRQPADATAARRTWPR